MGSSSTTYISRLGWFSAIFASFARTGPPERDLPGITVDRITQSHKLCCQKTDVAYVKFVVTVKALCRTNGGARSLRVVVRMRPAGSATAPAHFLALRRIARG